MQPQVEQKRTTQQEPQRQDRFEHLGAPALSLALDAIAFGSGPARVKALFKTNPLIFEGMNIADGTNLPSIKNVLVADLLKSQENLQLAA